MFRKKIITIFAIAFSFALTAILLGQIIHENNVGSFVAPGIRDIEYSIVTPDGLRREYAVHLPFPYSKNTTPLPVVLVFHGGGHDADTMKALTGFNEKSDQERFIVVYPNGTSSSGADSPWDADTCCGYKENTYSDDIGFVRVIIAQLLRDFNIDETRIYATGFSWGAVFTHRLGCELSDKIAAIAPVSGASNGEDCNPERPVPVIEFHELRSHIDLDYDSKIVYDSIIGSSWPGLNLCSPAHTVEKLFDAAQDDVTVIRESYVDCPGNGDVILYGHGGGHVWPGGKSIPQHMDAMKNISATDIIWDFFKAHPKLK